jgi:putative ABC transport system substrate-binding protein
MGMRRREFIGVLGGAAAWPLAAHAQQGERMRRVGLLMGYPEGQAEGQAMLASLQRGLRDLGWTEGRNLRIEAHWVGGDPNKARIAAKELIATTPDVIVPSTNMVVGIVQQETHTIPVIFVFVGDPVLSGYVSSLALPGGNMTGFAALEQSVGGKWVELLKEIVPNLRNLGVIVHLETPANVGLLRRAEAAAPALGVKLTTLGVHDAAEIERAVSNFASGPDAGLIVLPHAVTYGNRDLIHGLVARYRLPAVFPAGDFLKDGGLLSYGADPIEQFRQGASYVDRILKGAKPAELPVQFPTKYLLAINLKTAKVLGLAIPQSFLLRADEVIE